MFATGPRSEAEKNSVKALASVWCIPFWHPVFELFNRSNAYNNLKNLLQRTISWVVSRPWIFPCKLFGRLSYVTVALHVLFASSCPRHHISSAPIRVLNNAGFHFCPWNHELFCWCHNGWNIWSGRGKHCPKWEQWFLQPDLRSWDSLLFGWRDFYRWPSCVRRQNISFQWMKLYLHARIVGVFHGVLTVGPAFQCPL